MKAFVALGLMASLAIGGNVEASAYTGIVGTNSVGPSNSGSGLTRVSIILSTSTTSCGNPFAFAFEYDNSAVYQKAWTAMLLAAKTSGATIVINGSGACDQFGVESVQSLHMP